jgi:hypothetical protein
MNARTTKYYGDVILDLQDTNDKEEYVAKATGATHVGDDWLIPFERHDNECGNYIGDMRLRVSGDKVKGSGRFRFVGDRLIEAKIDGKITRKNKSTMTCEGTWREPGEGTLYSMRIDLVSA